MKMASSSFRKCSTNCRLLRMLSKFSLIHPSPLVYDGIFNTHIPRKRDARTDSFFLSARMQTQKCQEGFTTFTNDEFEDIINDEELKLSDEDIANVRKWFPMEEKGNFEKVRMYP